MMLSQNMHTYYYLSSNFSTTLIISMVSSDFYSSPNLLMRLNYQYNLIRSTIIYRHFLDPRMVILE
jgi:hypothetical protein